MISAVVAVMAGVNTLPNDFTYDDVTLVQHNPVVTGNAPLAHIWTRDWWAHAHPWDDARDLLYRPLTLLTFRANYLLGGGNPFGFHLVNLMLHAAVSALVVALALAVGCSAGAAAGAGLIFAVMPNHVEAVAGIVGRADLLATLFTLSAALIAVRARFETPRRAALYASLLTPALLAAMLSKENGVAAIILVPLFALVGSRDPHDSHPRRTSRSLYSAVRIPHSALSLVPALAATAIYLLLRYAALGGRLAQTVVPSNISNVLVDATAAERFWGAFQLLGLYLAKTFWPARLCMDYSFNAVRLADSIAHPHVVLGITGIVAVIIGACLCWTRWRRGMAAVCLAVLIAYLPVSNTFFLIKTIFAERVWYLPSAFLSIMVVAALAALLSNVEAMPRPLTTPLHRRGPAVALMLIVLAGLARCWQRSADWRDNAALFASAHRVHPDSAPVLFAYGQLLADRGDPRGAELLERCVRLAPGLTDAHVALGRVRLAQGAAEAAVARLQIALGQQPAYPGLSDLLDQAARRVAGERGPELDGLRESYQRRPDDLASLSAWVQGLMSVGQLETALDTLNQSGARFEASAAFQHLCAVALMTAGRRDEAVEAYRRCLELDGSRAEVMAELSLALMDRNAAGDAVEAGELTERAYRLAPDEVKVGIARAESFALQGQKAEAAAIYRRIIDKLPEGEQRITLEARLDLLHDQEP